MFISGESVEVWNLNPVDGASRLLDEARILESLVDLQKLQDLVAQLL